MKLIPLILSNFKRHKLRTILTILSIIVAFILFAYLSAIRNAFRAGITVAGADRLITRNRVTLIQPLPKAYESQIEQIPGVSIVTKASWFGGIYQDKPQAFPQIAVDPDEFLQVYPEFILTADEKKAWDATKTGCIVGKKVAEKYGFKVGDKIPIKATFNTPKSGGSLWTFDVVGIYHGAKPETDETTMYFRHDYLEENRLRGEGLTGWYYLKIADPKKAEEIVRRVDERFANSPYETKTETEKAFMRGFAEQAGNIGAIVVFILTAVFFTILVVAANTMAQAVRERIGELGVLKAIGFTDGQMLGLILAESLLIALIGGAVGLALGASFVKKGDPTGGGLPAFLLPTTDFLMGVAFVILLGIITGLWPALQAMRLNAVDALRRE